MDIWSEHGAYQGPEAFHTSRDAELHIDAAFVIYVRVRSCQGRRQVAYLPSHFEIHQQNYLPMWANTEYGSAPNRDLPPLSSIIRHPRPPCSNCKPSPRLAHPSSFSPARGRSQAEVLLSAATSNNNSSSNLLGISPPPPLLSSRLLTLESTPASTPHSQP
ncbi:hypothetical protein BDV95DRAFT_326077 [Massariosphaeria phaeospora]|uniref:Uncharacterized protein n=1 Tax=Massariosphaeria phaeospora TaxID=100035 RepID=A0A7C8MT10_9PLEO|nr:hypothetical protein BDV95DRAFT_326077 [Massariosphaeria phaeospora]